MAGLISPHQDSGIDEIGVVRLPFHEYGALTYDFSCPEIRKSETQPFGSDSDVNVGNRTYRLSIPSDSYDTHAGICEEEGDISQRSIFGHKTRELRNRFYEIHRLPSAYLRFPMSVSPIQLAR